ncbi:MAG: type I-U CRISPR-associated protein Cas8c [Gemmatimonadaceae bacterium]|nr:type I-U CRISPR-associated protein Cas8c [Gemmatimonadaceae bacterium]
MTTPTASFSIPVDVTNPGHVFACCGLLELGHRVWPGTEGWFERAEARFTLRAPARGPVEPSLAALVDAVAACGFQGELSPEERAELEKLERTKRALAKEGKTLSDAEEQRRVALGKLQREGAITLGAPFDLRVDWWQEDGDGVPKTFAGKQEVLRMALGMVPHLSHAARADSPMEYRSILQAVTEAGDPPTGSARGRSRGGNGSNGKVEPFYFDARRFAHALDVGFSLDVQEKTLRASAAPFTELLALIGLQRCRPRVAEDDRWAFDYFLWYQPLGVVAAAAVVSGSAKVDGGQRYRFRLEFRDDQRRYKAFGFATSHEVTHG